MSEVEITAGTVEPLEVHVQKASDGTALTGSTNLRVQIRRASDGFFFDFSDLTFKSAGWTTRQATLTEVSSTNDPGWYKLTGGVNTAGWTTGSYFVTFLEVTTTLAAGAPQFSTGELRLVTATASALSARLPPNLVDGRIDASVGAMATDVVTASAIAADAIGSSELAASAANEIADALLDRVLSGHTTAGTAGEALSRVDVAVSTRAAPGAAMDLVDDAVDAGAVAATAVTGIQAGLATSSSLSAVAVAVAALPSASAIADAVCDEALAGHVGAGSVGEALGRLDATVSSRSTLTASQVWSTALPGAFAAGQAGFLVGTYLDAAISSRPTAAVIADAVWDELLAGHAVAGSAGAAVSSLPSAAAVGAAVWATAEGTPVAGTFGYGLKLLRQGLTNRLEETAGNPGLLKLYADDGTTVLKTWQLRDGSGGAVTAQIGAPARRGAAT